MENKNTRSRLFGQLPIKQLIIQQSIPAMIGILTASLYMIVDTIFVGRWVGFEGIGAITVVMPVTFLVSTVGMSLGVGGASVISRALGSDDHERAHHTFGNQITLAVIMAGSAIFLGYLFREPIIHAFGGQGLLLEPSLVYYDITLGGVFFFAFAMMTNNVIRALGHPKVAMTVMIIPSIVNVVLDIVFIKYLDMGLAGAAWATNIAFFGSGLYGLYFLLFSKNKDLNLERRHFKLDWALDKEILSLGFVSFSRQAVMSLLAIVVNNSVIHFGSEIYVAVFGVINRVFMIVFAPSLGLTQGSLPIIGFNYGAKQFGRVRETVRKTIKYGILVSSIMFSILLIVKQPLVNLFTKEEFIRQETPQLLIIILAATPLIILQLIVGAYFQALGKAGASLFLTLLRQGMILIPLLLILPHFFGLKGIWFSYPLADLLAIGITLMFVRKEDSFRWRSPFS